MRLLVPLLCLLLAACNEGGGSPPPVVVGPITTVAAPPPSTAWTMSFGRPPGAVRMQPGDYFDFPVCAMAPSAEDPTQLTLPCSVGYVERATAPVVGRASVSLSYEITGSSPVFSCRTNLNNVDPCPATVSILLHRAGDVGGEFHRWFSEPQLLELGQHVLVAPLDPARWVSVFGKRGDAAPEDFRQALANIGSGGPVYGGGYFRAHGAALSSGTARFRVVSFGAQ